MVIHQFTEIHPSWGLKIRPNENVLIIGAPDLESRDFRSGAIAFFDPRSCDFLGQITCPSFDLMFRIGDSNANNDEKYFAKNQAYPLLPPSPVPKELRRFGATVDAWGNQIAVGNQGAPDGAAPPVILMDLSKEKAEGEGYLAIAAEGWGTFGYTQVTSPYHVEKNWYIERTRQALKSKDTVAAGGSGSRGFFIGGRLYISGVQHELRLPDKAMVYNEVFMYQNKGGNNFSPDFKYIFSDVNGTRPFDGYSDQYIGSDAEITPNRMLYVSENQANFDGHFSINERAISAPYYFYKLYKAFFVRDISGEPPYPIAKLSADYTQIGVPEVIKFSIPHGVIAAFPWESEPVYIFAYAPNIPMKAELQPGEKLPGMVTINRLSDKKFAILTKKEGAKDFVPSEEDALTHFVSVNRSFVYPLRLSLIGGGPLAILADFNFTASQVDLWLLDLTPPPLEDTDSLVETGDHSFSAYNLGVSIPVSSDAAMIATQEFWDELYAQIVFCWGESFPEVLVSLTPGLSKENIHRVVIADPDLIGIVNQKAWIAPDDAARITPPPATLRRKLRDWPLKYLCFREKFFGQQPTATPLMPASLPSAAASGVVTGVFDFSRETTPVIMDQLSASDGRVLEKVRVMQISLGSDGNTVQIIVNGRPAVSLAFEKLSPESQKALLDLCRNALRSKQ